MKTQCVLIDKILSHRRLVTVSMHPPGAGLYHLAGPELLVLA